MRLNKTLLTISTIGASLPSMAAINGLASSEVSLESVAAKAKSDKMNIVLLFVDDLGWADVGFRNAKFETPNVDQLRRDGLNFERAYVSQPASSASRASIMTGMEPVRWQVVRHIENKDAGSGKEYNMWEGDPIAMPSRNFLPLEARTYAEALKDYGYYNMFVGKWHLGGPEYWPHKQGFDETFGISDYGNVSSYYAPFFRFPNGDDTTKGAAKGELMSDYLTDKAVDMIENYDKEQPFLLSLSYYNVHTPNLGKKELVEKYMNEGMSQRDANYAAQVSVVDTSVGQIRKALEDKGIADNTVVIYFSDQGGPFSNYPLRGCKLIDDTLAEGGIRVPLIIYYPNVTKAGTTCHTPVQAIDIYPTFVEIASGKECKEEQVNGVSLMPLLKGKELKERNLHFFRSYIEQYAALINGDYKIIKWCTGEYQMYNLKNDIGETTDIQNVEPERFEKMKKDLIAWEEEAIPSYENDYKLRFNYKK
ncbi:MAG: sulfatase [Rikenellaceae bacterium]